MIFNKPPKYTSDDKEKKAEAFISFMDKAPPKERERVRAKEKEPVRLTSLRLPISLLEDLKEISNITGLSINSICMEILRPAIKKKLKELIAEL